MVLLQTIFLNYLYSINLADPYAQHHRDYSMKLEQNARLVKEYFQYVLQNCGMLY
ncbi:hypothetical protein HOLleu_13370 [Holothuria leucospilota]|uniref:Uncharacterized protein n=1 Tax=Holothuria leucospilota TaxID=206669 RepID=A0A9Q1HAT8_HOLLE|nr:hypothetical protein HOLleu_13370 [Holothuria leucospilota]